MISTPECFAAGCQLSSTHMLILGEIGTSFWYSEHYPQHLVGSDTSAKARQIARDVIDQLRGVKIASTEVYE